MSSAPFQRDVMAHLFAPPSSAGTALHPRWTLYRSMVRHRFEDLARGAFPRTSSLLPSELFHAALDEWLATKPPRTPYFWRVASELGDFLVPWAARDSERPWLVDLARLEHARWNVRNEVFADPPSIDPLTFERPVVLAPSLALLDVRYAVEEAFEGAPTERSATLALHRRPNDEVSTLLLNDAGAALLRALTEGLGTLAECALSVAKARDTRIDDAYFEALATLLALLVEEGVVLGSRSGT